MPSLPNAVPRRPHFLAALPDQRSVTPAGFANPDAEGFDDEGRGAPACAPFAPPAHPPPASAPAPHPAPAAAPAPAEPRPEQIDRLAMAVEALRLAGARLAEQARADALELAFHLARRILESELKTAPEPLFALVRSAIRRLGETRAVVVRLSPVDAARVESGAARLGEELNLARIEVRADPSLQRGDCIVESDLGEVDGRLSTRLNALRAALGDDPGGES